MVAKLGPLTAEQKAQLLQGEKDIDAHMQVYTKEEREVMLEKMHAASGSFYAAACRIGNHPFIEFTGLMNEYINVCQTAHDKGIDFTQCNTHSGMFLPMKEHNINYVNEKLECIFTGRSVMDKVGDLANG